MDQNPTTKLAAAVATLVGLWVAVYWMWQPARSKEPSISFASEPADREAGAVDSRSNPRTGVQRPVPEPGRGADPNRDPASKAGSPDRAARGDPESSTPIPLRGGDAQGDRQVPTDPGKPGDEPARDGSRPQVIVKPPKFEEYRVQPGETFETIAKKRYGSSTMSSAIKRANPFIDPMRLQPGRVILLPVDPSNIQGKVQIKPALAAREGWKIHKVGDGDTLSGLSKKYYGTTTLSRRIFEENRDRLRNENDLKLGLELLIPPPPAGDASGAKKPEGVSAR